MMVLVYHITRCFPDVSYISSWSKTKRFNSHRLLSQTWALWLRLSGAGGWGRCVTWMVLSRELQVFRERRGILSHISDSMEQWDRVRWGSCWVLSEERGKKYKTEDANLPLSSASVPNTSREVYSVVDQGYQYPTGFAPQHPDASRVPAASLGRSWCGCRESAF